MKNIVNTMLKQQKKLLLAPIACITLLFDRIMTNTYYRRWFINITGTALFLCWILLSSTLHAQNSHEREYLFDNLRRPRVFFAKTELFRYLQADGQTEFELVYKILNQDLQFLQHPQGLVATLDIKFDIFLHDELVQSNRFEHLAGAKTMAIAQSDKHYVLDKLSLTLAEEGYRVILEISDRNAATNFSAQYNLILLPSDTVISDLEISHGISIELTPALVNFQRGKYQFYVDPIPIVDANEKDFILYYQISNLQKDKNDLYVFSEQLIIKKDDNVVYQNDYNQSVESLPYPFVKRITIGEWEPGLYTLELKISDWTNRSFHAKQREFSLSREFVLLTQRVFSDDQDEFELISFFIDTRQKRLWRDLNETGRKSFIDRFWVANNPNPETEENIFLNLIRARVNEANWRFSYHLSGWKTDLGRIYIKYGTADQVTKDETPPDARYSRKPYQVWKYYGSDRSYLFLDFQGNGNYRLIYAKNDEMESIDPGWKGYFGNEFDFSKLDL